MICMPSRLKNSFFKINTSNKNILFDFFDFRPFIFFDFLTFLLFAFLS
jgi:hypothetical protein